jgi:sugar phosphate isomerase/epimerase
MTRTIVWTSVFAIAVMNLPLGAAAADSSGADKLGWKLALQSWTVHQTVAESIDIARQIGTRYIEIYPGQPLNPDDKAGKFGPGMTEEQVRKVLAKAKSSDVEIIDCGVIGIPAKEADARKLFDWAKKMGITTLVAEPDPKALPMIDKLAGEYGINVAIHDHPKPSRYWDPAYAYSLIKDLKHVGFCADVGHWKRSGLDPVAALKKYGDKVVSLHFKDLVPGGGSHGFHDAPWGTGENHAAEMLSVLKEKGFKGPVAIEYEWKWDVPTLQKCVQFFYDQANKLAGQ